jgi:hypothetical protein
VLNVLGACMLFNNIIIKRELKGNEWLYPNPDLLQINYDEIVSRLITNK